MSSSALPPDSLSAAAESNLKSRINAAFSMLKPKQLFNLLAQAKDKGQPYALIGSGVKAFAARSTLVKLEMRETSSMGRDTGEYELWIQAKTNGLSYDADVLNCGLFGENRDGKLVAPAFALNRDEIDLCNVYFVLGQGMPDLQDIPELNRINTALAAKGYQAWVAVAARMPGEVSVKPYEAEFVLALAASDADTAPLFNLSEHKLMASNYNGRQRLKPLPAHKPAALYQSLPA